MVDGRHDDAGCVVNDCYGERCCGMIVAVMTVTLLARRIYADCPSLFID